MDLAVIALYIGAVALVVVVRGAWRRRRSRSTEQYLEALRRVHDTANRVEGAPTASALTLDSYAAAPGPRLPAAVALSAVAAESLPAADSPATGTAPSAPPPRRVTLEGLLAGKAARVAAATVAVCALGGLGAALADGSGTGHARALAPLTRPSKHEVAGSPANTSVPAPPPASPLVVAGTTGSGRAAYTVTSGPVQLAVVASSRCWVELRASSVDGPILFEGVLAPGVERAFANAVGLWLRLGYPPGVAIEVDGKHLGLPTSAAPLDVTVGTSTASSA